MPAGRAIQARPAVMELSGFEPLTSWTRRSSPLRGLDHLVTAPAEIAGALSRLPPGSHPGEQRHGSHNTMGLWRPIQGLQSPMELSGFEPLTSWTRRSSPLRGLDHLVTAPAEIA